MLRNALRKRLLVTFSMAWLGSACASERDSLTAPSVALDAVSLNECNGGWGQLSAGAGAISSLTTPPPNSPPQQLGTVVVYGSPVQRPYRGFGEHSTYGGVTTVYTYDRNVLDECAFGTDRSFEDLGPREPEPSPTPIDMRAGIDTVLWSQLSESERRAVDRIADQFTPPSLVDASSVVRDFRVANTFNKVAALYLKARQDAAYERLPTEMLRLNRTGDATLSAREQLRLDAFTIGCNVLNGFYRFSPSWPIDELVDGAKRTMAAWAARQAAFMADARFSNELANLAALGVDVGVQFDECGTAAANHFEQRFRDLVPQGSGGGGGGTQF